MKYRNTKIHLTAYYESLTYLLKRAIGNKFNTLNKAAIKSELLCGKGKVKAVSPFYWNKHIERIKISPQNETRNIIKEYFYRDYFELNPLTIYWLKNAVLLDGSIYSNGYRRELRTRADQNRIGLKPGSPVIHMQSAALASTSVGSTWWGHWIRDEIPIQLLASDYAPLIEFKRKRHRDEQDYYNAFSLTNPKCVNTGYFDELIITDEHAQNPLKTKRYHELRKRLIHIQGSADKIFLIRGESGSKRILENENEIREILEKNGFISVDISSTTGEELINICRGAEFVVSVEGSHLSPLLFLLKDYASIVILNPPQRIGTNISDVCPFFCISSSMFICEQSKNLSENFYANPDELLQFIDEMLIYSEKNKSQLDLFLGNILNKRYIR